MQQEADMAISWAQAQLDFPQAQAQALRDRTCFCMCGCRAPETVPWAVLGEPIPGICAACRKHARGHDRIASAAMYMSFMDDPEPEPVVTRRPKPNPRHDRTTREQRWRAIDYIERKANDPTRLVMDLLGKVERGERLTDRQVESILAAEEAEKRDHGRAYKRLLADHQRRGKATDLTRLHIPETVQDGRYAVMSETGDILPVEVERPTSGLLRGAVVVTIHIGDTKRYGVQIPGPLRFLGRQPTYRGWFPQVVADLVANPDAASQMYKEIGDG